MQFVINLFCIVLQTVAKKKLSSDDGQDQPYKYLRMDYDPEQEVVVHNKELSLLKCS